MMLRRLPAILVSLVIVMAACTNAPEAASDSQNRAAGLIAAVDETVGSAAPSAGLVVPDGCELVQTIDEYGFAVEVVDCDDATSVPSDPPPGTPPTLDEWIGSTEARTLSVALRDALVIDAGCDATSVLALATEIEQSPDVISPLLDAIADALARSAAVCGIDNVEWVNAMDVAGDGLDALVAYLDAAEEDADG